MAEDAGAPRAASAEAGSGSGAAAAASSAQKRPRGAHLKPEKPPRPEGLPKRRALPHEGSCSAALLIALHREGLRTRRKCAATTKQQHPYISPYLPTSPHISVQVRNPLYLSHILMPMAYAVLTLTLTLTLISLLQEMEALKQLVGSRSSVRTQM